MPNPSFDDILSTTINRHRDTLADNIFQASPLTFLLKEKAKIVEAGGDVIVEPVIYDQNASAASYSGTDTLNTALNQTFTSATFNWKQLAASVVITGTDEIKNSSKEQIINLLEARVKTAELSLIEIMNQQLYLDGTGNSSKNLLGLAAIVAVTSTTGTLGGIDRSVAANAFWRNQTNITGGTWDVGTDMETSAMNELRRAYTSCVFGRQAPDLIIMKEGHYVGFERALDAKVRLQHEAMGAAGFESLVYKGKPVVFDRDMTGTTDIYLLNTNFLKFTIHRDRNFVVSPFVKPTNQDLRVAQLFFAGNLTTSGPRFLGQISGLTA